MLWGHFYHISYMPWICFLLPGPDLWPFVVKRAGLFSVLVRRGVTEGVTLLLLALQTGLLDMQALQRAFLLSIILFIVVTSTLQSMIEITDPVILALGASRNRYSLCETFNKTQGKLPETQTFRSFYSHHFYFTKHYFLLSGVCGNTSGASACVYFCWFFLCLWLIKSPSSSIWTSGSWYWFLAAC